MRPWEFILVLAFCLCAAGTVYTYMLYPLLLRVLSCRFGTIPKAPSVREEALPKICLLIVAHNEESVIASRIENALQIDYPSEKLEIVIGSDASTDRTTQIASDYACRGVRLIHAPVRRGKASVLRAAFEILTGDIVLLSDANTFTEPDAARLLVRWFADPAVGVVCGRLALSDPASGKNADSLYWRYETFLKIQEARLGGLLGANGAIYAIRKSAFVPIPDNTIVDDFVIPLLAKMRTSCRIIYDPEATAREETAPDVGAEFERRSRIGAGGWQAVTWLWPLLDPRKGWICFTFLSHKILRWLCPFFLMGMFIASALLCFDPRFRTLFLIQVLVYAIAILANWVPANLPLSRILRAGNMFVVMNAALLVGFFRWLGGARDGVWVRTRRGTNSPGQLAGA